MYLSAGLKVVISATFLYFPNKNFFNKKKITKQNNYKLP